MENPKIYCQYHTLQKTDTLVEHPKNPNTHPEDQLKRLGRIIELNGWRSPVVVSKRSGFIIKGHGRTQAAKLAGWTEVPVELQEYESEAKEYADMIADNYIAELAEIDNAKFESVVMEYKDMGGDIGAMGINNLSEVIEVVNKAAGDEEAVPALPKTPKTVKGDLYEIGQHRLLCGDCLSFDSIKRLAMEDRADQLLTDPPYNVAYVGKTKEAMTIENDKMEDKAFRQFLRDAFTSANSVMREGATFYIWHADSEGFNFRGACNDIEWQVRQCLIWKKNTMVMGRQDYHWKHEPCLYGWKAGAAHLWNTDRTQTTILEFDRPSSSQDHPTTKPIDLFAYQIGNNTKEGQIVLDLFGGSGTTMIAAHKLNRKCLMTEIDPLYCDVIVTRMKKLYPDLQIKLNGKPIEWSL